MQHASHLIKNGELHAPALQRFSHMAHHLRLTFEVKLKWHVHVVLTHHTAQVKAQVNLGPANQY